MTSLLLEQTAAAVDVVAAVPSVYEGLDDNELMQQSRLDSALLRLAQKRVALGAAEIARRSAPDLGSAGLAQRTGFRTPIELVKSTTGSTGTEASKAIRVGSLVADSPSSPIAIAVLDDSISVAAADAIRAGLGEPTAEVTAGILADAASALCALDLDPDRLFKRAREVRDELDEAGIPDREAARRESRSLRITRLPDGMTLLNWRMDPETAAHVGELFDRATSPRRGGPRFVNPDDSAQAEAIADDPRTNEQLASDVFLDLLRNGADADSSQLLGSGAPVVRAVKTERGYGFIEGQDDPISVETVERLSCMATIQDIRFNPNGEVIDLGREQRLFNRRQKGALAARDGGCMWPGCCRPPSWTEAHHIVTWAREKGRTDLINGILLCRFHHLLLHNNHWEIYTRGGRFWLVPPKTVDPSQTAQLLPSKSRALRESVQRRA